MSKTFGNETVMELLAEYAGKHKGARPLVYEEGYRSSFCVVCDESEDEWLAEITERFCRNNYKIPTEEDYQFWLEIRNVFTDICWTSSSSDNFSQELEIEYHLDGAMPLVLLVDKEKTAAAVFVSHASDYYDCTPDGKTYRWDEFENVVSSFFSATGETKNPLWIVVLDKSFRDSSPFAEDDPSDQDILSPVKNADDPHAATNQLALCKRYTEILGLSDGQTDSERKSYPGFRDVLIELIHMQGIKDSELYRCACISPQVFDRIINDRNSKAPTRKTVIKLAVALRLSPEKSEAFLAAAGYAFALNDPSERIIVEQIECGNFDIDRINDVLYENHLPTI